MMARGGVTTAMDHHYVFPRGAGDLPGADHPGRRARLGVRFTLARGSMDRGESRRRTAAGLRRRDPRGRARRHRGGRRRAPRRLLRRDDADRRRALLAVLRLHRTACGRPPSWPAARACGCTPTARETVEEEQFCKELFGMGPTDYFESTGWLGEDVWMAHCVHMNDSDIAAFARTGPASPTARPPTPGWPPGSPGSPTCWRPASRSASAWTAPRPTSPANSTPNCATPCSSTASARTARRR